MVLDRTMFHYRNLAATWLDQAQRNNLLTDCSCAGTQGWEGQREKRGGEDEQGREEEVGGGDKESRRGDERKGEQQ